MYPISLYRLGLFFTLIFLKATVFLLLPGLRSAPLSPHAQ